MSGSSRKWPASGAAVFLHPEGRLHTEHEVAGVTEIEVGAGEDGGAQIHHQTGHGGHQHHAHEIAERVEVRAGENVARFLEARLLHHPELPGRPGLSAQQYITQRTGRLGLEQDQRAAGEIAHHVHQDGRHHLVATADQVGHILQRPHVDLGHGDHDRAVGHLRQRGGRVAGPDVGDLPQGVELQLLQLPDVFHGSPSYNSAAASRMSAGAPSARIVAPPTNGGMPVGASNGSTTMSCCPARASTTSAVRRSPNSRITVGARAAGAPPIAPDQVAEVHRGHHPIAHQERLPVPHGRHRPGVELHRLRHVRQRHGIAFLAGPGQQRPHDRERERHPHREGGAPSQLAPHFQGAAERAHPGHGDVHADPPPRDPAHRRRRAESRPGQHPEQEVVAQGFGGRVGQPLPPGLRQDGGPVDAPAVVADPEGHAVPLPRGGEEDPALLRLAFGRADLAPLDP